MGIWSKQSYAPKIIKIYFLLFVIVTRNSKTSPKTVWLIFIDVQNQIIGQRRNRQNKETFTTEVVKNKIRQYQTHYNKQYYIHNKFGLIPKFLWFPNPNQLGRGNSAKFVLSDNKQIADKTT